MNYWVFTDQQLKEALAEHFKHKGQETQCHGVKQFLHSDACRERGMIRGEETSNG